jgi:uncharacterized protein YdeI (YjbR/CyaY-like superfamily)
MKNPKVDTYLEQATKWKNEQYLLRELLLDCGLDEAFKWRVPCYMSQGRNICLLGAFKDYAVLTFFKGMLLQDEQKLLHVPGEHSQSTKYFKFTSVEQILELKDTIKAYLFEAMEIEKSGIKIEKTKSEVLEYPEELVSIFMQNSELKQAFEGLTKGRQRAYIMHFTGTNNPKTRIARIERSMKRILAGKGIHDCTCGLSKRYPNCDGSHKQIEGYQF